MNSGSGSSRSSEQRRQQQKQLQQGNARRCWRAVYQANCYEMCNQMSELTLLKHACMIHACKLYKVLYNLPRTKIGTLCTHAKPASLYRDMSTPPAPCRHGRAERKTLDRSQENLTIYKYTSTDKLYKTSIPECINLDST